jgi:predicted GNAT family N-acyltransferase
MAKVETFICDVCGKDRREDVNHWHQVEAHGEVFAIGRLAPRQADAQYPGYSFADVCGNECATKLFQRWLTTGKLTQ